MGTSGTRGLVSASVRGKDGVKETEEALRGWERHNKNVPKTALAAAQIVHGQQFPPNFSHLPVPLFTNTKPPLPALASVQALQTSLPHHPHLPGAGAERVSVAEPPPQQGPWRATGQGCVSLDLLTPTPCFASSPERVGVAGNGASTPAKVKENRGGRTNVCFQMELKV